jgi:Ca2+-transporting ATPase
MALAAWRISRNHVLTRHAPVIEALGSATVLCTDKTGTLTENRMTVSTVVIGDSVSALDDRGQADLPAPVRALLDCAVLASEILPFDPMEKAFQRCFNAHFPTEIARYANWALAYEYPLTHDIKAMTHVWRQADATDLVVATKGAPESIALLCRLNAQEVDAMMRQVETLAVQGMRVLGVARALTPADSRPLQVTAFDFQFLGLVGLLDPVRAAVPDAVRECQQAGIRVVMITGDYPSTALAIARQAGITADQVVTGQQLDTLSATALCALVRDASVYARILPEQKLRMVEAFKTNLEVVAMTGDGVNDAPALKAAHIGISMGERGTDVAREASSLILLDDDFTSIVSTIKLGRRLYDNLRLAMTYLIAAHLPIAGMTLLPLLLGTPLVFAPVHIVFLEMIINPACAIVFESEEADRDIMRRAPRKLDERLFGHRLVIMSALQGLGLLAAVAAVFFVARQAGLADDSARALSFSCLVLGNLGLIVSSRSLSLNAAALLKKPNQAQWWILAGTLCALGLSLSWAPIRGAFHFAPFAPSWLLLPILGGCATLVWIETVKYMYRLLRARP